jgi:chorismate-pyruvate lyase
VMNAGTATLPLEKLGLVPRILLATDGTLTHILEAYAAERVALVKLAHALVTEPVVRSGLGLEQGETALRRIILLRGSRSGTTFVFADSVVMLDRLPTSVAEGLLETDTPIGKLLYACRAETFREIITMGEERDPAVAAHFGVDGCEPIVFRTYQIVHEDRPIVRITEKFPRTWFPDAEIRR